MILRILPHVQLDFVPFAQDSVSRHMVTLACSNFLQQHLAYFRECQISTKLFVL